MFDCENKHFITIYTKQLIYFYNLICITHLFLVFTPFIHTQSNLSFPSSLSCFVKKTTFLHKNKPISLLPLTNSMLNSSSRSSLKAICTLALFNPIPSSLLIKSKRPSATATFNFSQSTLKSCKSPSEEWLIYSWSRKNTLMWNPWKKQFISWLPGLRMKWTKTNSLSNDCKKLKMPFLECMLQNNKMRKSPL